MFWIKSISETSMVELIPIFWSPYGLNPEQCESQWELRELSPCQEVPSTLQNRVCRWQAL